ncbi:ABC-2 type transporter family protein, partial [Yersinia pestis PY-94]
MTRLYWINF